MSTDDAASLNNPQPAPVLWSSHCFVTGFQVIYFHLTVVVLQVLH